MVPCVGCGFCCISIPCAVSFKKYDGTQYEDVEPCPELEWTGKRYNCKLHDNPELKKEVGIGTGCPFPFVRWRENIQQQTKEQMFDEGPEHLFGRKKENKLGWLFWFFIVILLIGSIWAIFKT